MSSITILVIFVICMAVSLAAGISMIVPLFIGFLLFGFRAYKMGFGTKEIFRLVIPGVKDSMIVIRIILIIGCMTGIWRICGTVALFVVGGVQVLPASLFVLTAFLLSSAMSYALGTSFGVTATCGTIMMAIARAGNVNTVITAAAVLSGVYVGDRGSPSASSANLVAVLTHTNMSDNIKVMFKSALVPFILSTLFYFAVSFFFPMSEIDTTLLNSFKDAFNLNLVCIIPAVVMLILPFCHVPIIWCMSLSILASFLVGLFVQGNSVGELIKAMILGYTSDDPFLNSTLSGGGLVSMAEVCVILLISGTYGGLFKETKLLEPLTRKMERLSAKTGRFAVMVIMGITLCGIFCNQTIGVIMQNQLSNGLYGDSDDEKTEKMLDIEDSSIVIAGLIPWCIASSVPLSMMNADFRSVPLACYLWLIPLCHYVRERKKQKADLQT